MNYNEYTLVSFGDSFTFGQGSKLGAENDFTIPANQYSTERKRFKKVSNSGSYTKMIKTLLGFKSAINLGLPGASNKRTLTTIKDHTRRYGKENKFYIIGLTDPGRDMLYTMDSGTKLYTSYDFLYNNWSNERLTPKLKEIKNVLKISDMAMSEMLAYYFNNFTILLNHIIVYESIVDYLNSEDIPYVIFDITNDTPSSNDRYDVLNKIVKEYAISDYFFDDDVYVDDKAYIENYFSDLKDLKNPVYLNYHSMKHHYPTYLNKKQPLNPDMVNLCRYVFSYPEGDYRDYLSPIKGDVHWSMKGHKVFAELISDWITKNYGDKNE